MDLQKTVRFIGFYQNVKELLSISYLFVQPTLLELHSITMLEAMCMKIPVLASRGVGANNNFINHGINGFLLNPHNSKEWAETIDTLLKEKNLKRAISNAGRKLVETKGDIRTTAKTFEDLYFHLIKRSAQ